MTLDTLFATLFMTINVCSINAFPSFSPEAFSPQAFSSQAKKDSSNKKDGPQEESTNDRFKLKAPTPRNLSPLEKRIASFFSNEIMPIAQGLNKITVGKEADAAREARIKLLQQRAAQKRARPSAGRSRRVSTPSSGGGRWGGSSWGGGGSGGGSWGGYRPSYGGSSRPSWGQNYSPAASSWGKSSYPSSSGSYRPSSWQSSSTPSASRSPYTYADVDVDDSGEESKPIKRPRSKKSSSKKYTKHKDALYAAKKAIITRMEEIIDQAQTAKEDEAVDMQDFYAKQLAKSGQFVEKFEALRKAYKNVPSLWQKEFDQEFQKAKPIVTQFMPHLIRMLIYPTDDTNLEIKQDNAREIAYTPLREFFEYEALKKIITTQDGELAQYYEKQSATAYQNASNAKSTTPPNPIEEVDKIVLEKAQKTLAILIKKFDQFVDPEDPKKLLLEPAKVEALYKKMSTILE